MTWQFSPYLWPLVATVALGALCIHAIWPLRRAPGARTLISVIVAASGWALTDLVQYGYQVLGPKIVWSTLIYVWSGLTAVLWFYFCLQYTHRRGRLRPSELASLLVIPAVGVLLGLIFPLDGPMRTNVTLKSVDGLVHISRTYGPYFWFMVIYLQVLTLAGSVLLLRHSLRSNRLFGSQGITLTLAAVIPLITNVVYLATGYRYFHIDPTPVAMAVSGALLVVALREMALFDLAPAAREAAIEAMQDGWLVMDSADRIVDLNPAARGALVRGGIVSARVSNLAGRRMSILAPALSPVMRTQMEPAARDQPVTLGRGAAARQYRVSQGEIKDRYGQPAGYVLTLHDVTRQLASEREREQLVADLQQALAEVRQLSGLLPICSSCKRIRDGEGNWTQLETYLGQHSEASFTHGLCPDCLRRLQEQADDMEILRHNGTPPAPVAPGGHSDTRAN